MSESMLFIKKFCQSLYLFPAGNTPSRKNSLLVYSSITKVGFSKE